MLHKLASNYPKTHIKQSKSNNLTTKLQKDTNTTHPPEEPQNLKPIYALELLKSNNLTPKIHFLTLCIRSPYTRNRK